MILVLLHRIFPPACDWLPLWPPWYTPAEPDSEDRGSAEKGGLPRISQLANLGSLIYHHLPLMFIDVHIHNMS